MAGSPAQGPRVSITDGFFRSPNSPSPLCEAGSSAEPIPGPRAILKPQGLHVCSRAKYRRGTAFSWHGHLGRGRTGFQPVPYQQNGKISCPARGSLNPEGLGHGLKHNSSLPPAHLLLMNPMIRHSERSAAQSRNLLKQALVRLRPLTPRRFILRRSTRIRQDVLCHENQPRHHG